MSKKVNTILFILGATVFNIIIMIIIFTVLFIVFGMVLSPSLSQGVVMFFMFLFFLISIGGTYFIYHKLVKFFSNKIDMDKYFSPLFKKK